MLVYFFSAKMYQLLNIFDFLFQFIIDLLGCGVDSIACDKLTLCLMFTDSRVLCCCTGRASPSIPCKLFSGMFDFFPFDLLCPFQLMFPTPLNFETIFNE